MLSPILVLKLLTVLLNALKTVTTLISGKDVDLAGDDANAKSEKPKQPNGKDFELPR
jgi:hypothetical protein